jgi:hypothetical protein
MRLAQISHPMAKVAGIYRFDFCQLVEVTIRAENAWGRDSTENGEGHARLTAMDVRARVPLSPGCGSGTWLVQPQFPCHIPKRLAVLPIDHSLSLTDEFIPNSFPEFQSFIGITQDFEGLLLNCGFDNSLKHFLELRLGHLGNCIIGNVIFLSNS